MAAPLGHRNIAEQAEIAAAGHGVARDRGGGAGVLQADLVGAELQRPFAGPLLARGHAEDALVKGARRIDVVHAEDDVVEGGDRKARVAHAKTPISASAPAVLRNSHMIWRPLRSAALLRTVASQPPPTTATTARGVPGQATVPEPTSITPADAWTANMIARTTP